MTDARPKITLPANGWRIRPYQEKLFGYLEEGGKRAIAIWPRRTGKDEIALHNTAIQAHQRIGNYWHCLPEYGQGRKAIWTAVNGNTGRRRIDEAFPEALRASTNDNEMFIRFTNGSTWQVIGSDRYDQTVGSGVLGIVYSEWALSNPSSWAYHRPIVEENKGWALFITTPRGHNHAKTMYDMAQENPEWFSERLSIEDTGTMDPLLLERAKAEYVALYGKDYGEAQFLQEYYCDWSASILGAFYHHEMKDVRDQDRITENVKVDPQRPVHRAWDIGVRDDTAIWFYQTIGAQVMVLDCYMASGVGLDHFRDVVEEKHALRKWKHGTDYVPHDAKVREWGSGRSRVETMTGMGFKPHLVLGASVLDGINAVRRTLPFCVFHPRCGDGLSALEQYRREWDDDRKTFKPSAVHDWTSHPADAFRYLSLAWRLSKRAPPVVGATSTGGIILPPPPVENIRRGGIEL